MAKTAKKTNNKLFICCVQDSDGRIIKIFTGNNYDQVWLMGSTEAKSARGHWTLFDQQARQIDGNYKPVNIV